MTARAAMIWACVMCGAAACPAPATVSRYAARHDLVGAVGYGLASTVALHRLFYCLRDVPAADAAGSDSPPPA